MRRFSQRNSLVTLSDINITPLLDLAFVLLIIFVITTPLLEQSIKLDLPKGGRPEKTLTKDDVRVVDVSRDGYFVLRGQRLSLTGVERTLVAAYRTNPNLVVRIRADEKAPYGWVTALLDRCTRHGITRVAFATQPEKP